MFDIFYDRERREISLLHCCVLIRVPRLPIMLDRHQVRIVLGIAHPGYRRRMKHRLGWFGRFLPDREWQIVDGREQLVSVWRR